MHDAGMDLGRRSKRLGRQIHDDLRVTAPLGQNRQSTIGFCPSFRDDPFGDLTLEHQRQAAPEWRPDLGRQPTDQQLRPDVIGQFETILIGG